MKRILLLAALPFTLLALSACSGSDSASAAKVNGESIEDKAFLDELKAYQDNKQYQSNAQTAVVGADGTVKADFARSALLNQIILTLARQEVEHRGLDVSKADPAQVTALVNQIYGGNPQDSASFDAFSDSFKERARKEVESFVTLEQSFAADVTDDQIKAAYDAEPHRWANLCASHILVATEQEAQAVKARLDAGEDFGKVAKDVSTDTGSGANGGSLVGSDGKCVPAQSYVKEFVDGALAAKVGVPTDPVQSQFGYHIIRVDKWEDVPFDQAKDSVRAKLEQDAQAKGGTALNAWLTTALKGDIWVNPRYGTFDPNTNRIVASSTKAAGATSTSTP
jgi:parvulin-like peptidyl-prolyl isomerase